MEHISKYFGIFLLILIASPAMAQMGSGRGDRDPAQMQEMLEERFEEAGISLPEDWDEMTEDERRGFMMENDLGGGPGGRGERQDGERGTWNGSGGILGGRGGPMGGDFPEDWDEMTEEQRRTYMEENRSEGMGERGEINRGTIQRNYLRNARKAARYQKFSGVLEVEKSFTDDYLITNKEAVRFLQQRGILGGNDDGSFLPQNSINRAESLKVLLEALGEIPTEEDADGYFSDVNPDAWYAGYIGRAYKLGVVQGYANRMFKPGQTVNQVELLKIAIESFGIDLSDYPETILPSGVDASAWFAPYLQYAIDNNLLDSDEIDPAIGMTREQFSEFIYRLIQQQESLE